MVLSLVSQEKREERKWKGKMLLCVLFVSLCVGAKARTDRKITIVHRTQSELKRFAGVEESMRERVMHSEGVVVVLLLSIALPPPHLSPISPEAPLPCCADILQRDSKVAYAPPSPSQ